MGKIEFFSINKPQKAYSFIVLACLLFTLTLTSTIQKAHGMGRISHHTPNKLPSRWQNRAYNHLYKSNHQLAKSRLVTNKNKHSVHKATRKEHSNKQEISVNSDAQTTSFAAQALVDHLQTKELMPGIVYKKGSGPLRLNILDIDTVQAPVLIKPIVAPPGTTRLQTVKDHTFSSHAIAAINANYFKNTGVPLGTLIIDGDWVAGPLYDRVALGISQSGFVRIDRVGLGGTLYTSNPEIPQLWINNINVPRRSGCRTVAYSRRWGDSVHLQYDGCLVAIDAQGRVLDSNMRNMVIPYGGIVLSDSKNSDISALRRGDQTYLRWQVAPSAWSDITQAVSGGPMLIKDNNYCINLKAESFRNNWTSNSIKARTACGITANNHLILVTAEGNHTLYDLAHILHELGAVDAMNLDGGGSTTMVIHDSTVNMESKSKERRVAVALGIFVMDKKDKSAYYNRPCTYVPYKETFSISGDKTGAACCAEQQKLVQQVINGALNLTPPITAEKPLENQPVAN